MMLLFRAVMLPIKFCYVTQITFMSFFRLPLYMCIVRIFPINQLPLYVCVYMCKIDSTSLKNLVGKTEIFQVSFYSSSCNLGLELTIM